VELERDTRSRFIETRPPYLLEDLSSVCVSDLHEFSCPLNVHSNFESHTFFITSFTCTLPHKNEWLQLSRLFREEVIAAHVMSK